MKLKIIDKNTYGTTLHTRITFNNKEEDIDYDLYLDEILDDGEVMESITTNIVNRETGKELNPDDPKYEEINNFLDNNADQLDNL